MEATKIVLEAAEEEITGRREGALSLLWAILVDGVSSYRNAIARGAVYGADYRETERWIFGPDSKGLTSFATLCAVFDIDPRRLREELRSYRQKRTEEGLRIVERLHRPAG